MGITKVLGAAAVALAIAANGVAVGAAFAAAGAPESQPGGRFTDPFAYCAAVGTIDAPDARYSGPPVPEAIARGMKRALGAAPDAPLDTFVRGTSWRCMDGQVWACNVGANLPCGERADASREPSPAMTTFCRESPTAEVIPAYVTGRATIYAWRCRDGRPEIVRAVTGADPRGFVAGVWHRIAPPPPS